MHCQPVCWRGGRCPWRVCALWRPRCPRRARRGLTVVRMQRATRSFEQAQAVVPVPATPARRGHRTLAAGTVLEDRYEIQRVCGRGGMSTVYMARDLRFSQVERLCAIKEMFDLDPDANLRALRLVNFEREAALLATISHPSVPRIYDYFQHG